MKSNLKLAIKAILLSGAALAASNATATDKELLDTLLSNGSINKSQYNDLLKKEAAPTSEAGHTHKDSTKDKNGVSVSLKGGHFKMKSNDGNFTMGIGGRMMVDTGWFDSNSMNSKSENYLNGSELHRFRIHVKGTVFHDFKYKFAYDFGGKGTIKDAWISYTGLEEIFKVPFEIIVGNDKEPLGLEYVNSSKYLTFMERGLTQTFAPERAIGASFIAHDDIGPGSWSAWAGWYGNDVNSSATTGGGGGAKAFGSQAFAGRLTYAPIVSKTALLHFGGSVEQRGYSHANNRVGFSPRPEQHLVKDFIGNGAVNKIAVTSSTKWALEASGVYGPFAVQSEYFATSLTTADHKKVNMDAWYAFASWFITGESRRYNKNVGAFSRVKPSNDILSEGGWGALEVAYRFSYLDMSGIQQAGGNLGRQHNSTFGVNWYPTSNVKFMANYVIAQSAGHPATTVNNNHYNAFQLRAQIDF